VRQSSGFVHQQGQGVFFFVVLVVGAEGCVAGACFSKKPFACLVLSCFWLRCSSKPPPPGFVSVLSQIVQGGRSGEGGEEEALCNCASPGQHPEIGCISLYSSPLACPSPSAPPPRVKVNRTKRHFKKAKQENTETQMATFRKTLAGDAAFSFTFLLFFLFLCPPVRHANNKGFIYLGVYRAFARTPFYFFLSIERTVLIAAGILFLGNVHTCTKTKKETLLL
jgi:hypothetical protein